MKFTDLHDRKALYRLVKVALKSPNYEEFESRILRHAGWFLRTPDMRRWSKVTLRTFYDMRKNVLKDGMKRL